jgi:hypothetical protein
MTRFFRRAEAGSHAQRHYLYFHESLAICCDQRATFTLKERSRLDERKLAALESERFWRYFSCR